MGSVQQTLMQRLYGTDIWAGFKPIETGEAVQGWNGNHPSLRRLTSGGGSTVVVDIGVWKGQSTITMAKSMKDAGIDGVVLAIDTFLGSPEHWEGRHALYARHHGHPDLYWTFLSNVMHAGLSDYVIPVPQTSTTAAVILRRQKVLANLIHVDAAHEYREVMNDARDYWPVLAHGGFMIGDDYGESWPGVVKAAHEFSTAMDLPLSIEKPKWIMQKPV